MLTNVYTQFAMRKDENDCKNGVASKAYRAACATQLMLTEITANVKKARLLLNAVGRRTSAVVR
jgi:hypothetical protein